MKIRHQNNCSSFENFMQNMKKIGHVYDPCNAFYRGKVRHLLTACLCSI